GLGGGAEGGGAAVGGRVGRAAVGAAALVPGAEGYPVAHRAVEVGVGHKADEGAGVGRQEPRGGVRWVAEIGPVRPAVGAELPAAVAVVNGDDGDALDGIGVGVGDGVDAGGGEDVPDPVARVGRRILGDGSQRQVAAVVQHRGDVFIYPQLHTVGIVLRRKEECGIDRCQRGRVGTPGAREDVLYQVRPRLGPVALPQLGPVHSVVDREQQRAVDVGQVAGVRAAIGAGNNVLDEDGAGVGAVALPHFSPVGAVVGREHQRAVDVGQVGGVGAAVGAGVDVLDEDGAGAGAVAHPQFTAVGAVVGREEQRPVDVGQLARVGAVVVAGADVRDEDGAGRGAVALPQFPPVAAAVGGDEQRAVAVRHLACLGTAVAACRASPP